MAKFYALVPHEILFNDDLTDGEKLIAGLINGFCDKRGACDLTNQEIGKMMNKTEGAINKIVQRLIKKGVVESNSKTRNRLLKMVAIRDNLTLIGDGDSGQFDPNIRDNLTLMHTTDPNTKQIHSSQKPRHGVDDAFEMLWKQYPKKSGKKWAIKKFSKLRLAKDAERISKAIEHYKTTRMVFDGKILDFTNFLEVWDEYENGLPEGVAPAPGAVNFSKPQKISPNGAALIDKLGRLREVLMVNPELRAEVMRVPPENLTKKDGAALFTLQEADAIERLGGLELAVVQILEPDYIAKIERALQQVGQNDQAA